MSLDRVLQRWGYAKRRLRVTLARWRGARIATGAGLDQGVRLLTPSACTLGAGSMLYQQVQVMVTPGGQFQLGARSHLAPWGYLLIEDQCLQIGEQVAIGPFCSVFCVSNVPTLTQAMATVKHKAGVTIGNNVFIGSQCVILPGTLIEDDVCVAANSVVQGRLERGWLYAGSPAVKKKPLAGGPA
ncbi:MULTISPECIES: acyltransferase [Leeia]|nr:DapH/DapD/GlmU-related protein [Leeia aquatica]